MPDIFTPNYNFTKPEVNASRDTWGAKINDNWGSLDTALKAIADNVETRIVGDLGAKRLGFVDGDKTKPYVIFRAADNTTAAVELATKAYAVSVGVPQGAILMWSGSIASIPTGFALCNGANGRPDLRSRFIMGAGETPHVAPGNTGGSSQHDHAGTTGQTAITVAQMPYHNHGVNDGGHAHNGYTSDNGEHSHYSDLPVAAGAGGGSALATGGQQSTNRYQTTSSGSHSHTIQTDNRNANISVGYSGSNQGHAHFIGAINHLPPYYTLCFIIKL